MDEYRVGDLILCKNGTILDRIIERIEDDSIYYHTAGIVDSHRTVEAIWSGVHYAKIADYTNCDFFTCDILTDDQRLQIIKYVEERIGLPYDYELLLWEASRYLLHIVWPYVEYKKVICSMLWYEAYKSVGIDLTTGIEYPSPADLSNSKLLRRSNNYDRETFKKANNIKRRIRTG